MPKVSICIPCYNNADEVARLLQSICEQEFRDYEVNISDDSTNDEIALLIKNQFPEVNYQHNEIGRAHV